MANLRIDRLANSDLVICFRFAAIRMRSKSRFPMRTEVPFMRGGLKFFSLAISFFFLLCYF